MENYLNEKFGEVLKPKNSSEEVLKRWRKLRWVVKNPKRRFRFTANLSDPHEAAAIRKRSQEKLRLATYVPKAALLFLEYFLPSEYTLPKKVKAAGFQICAHELGSIVKGHDLAKLKVHGGVAGIAEKLSTSITDGLSTEHDLLSRRQEIYGINRFTKNQVRSFWGCVWEALQDKTLMIECACAFVSLIVRMIKEGSPKWAHIHDMLGMVARILLVVFVTATFDYWQCLLFKDWDKLKKMIYIQVTRDGNGQKLPMYDLLPGDIVHLAIGDQVPADGLFVSGLSVLIDKSSLTGESEPVMVNHENPFLLSGTKVQEGSFKMMVTAVGIRTQRGKLLETLGKVGDDETPLQVKLNGVTNFIEMIGLFFAILTFSVLVQGLFSCKLQQGTHWSWSEDDVLEMLDSFALAVAIVGVAVPGGLPLAVKLSLTFAMNKMRNDKALVLHLAACETMGSATCICHDKTGTLTTNHMTVVKSCICMNVKEVSKPNKASSLCSEIPESAVKLLLQSIFNNTGGEVVINKEGKLEILGTPTDTALLEFGLSLGGDFQVERQASRLVKVEPFNSVKKLMGVVLELPEGGLRAHYKGASEIVLAACDKVINSNGDNINTAKAIARECGILSNDGLAIEGSVFWKKSREELHELVPKLQVMARCSPLDKQALVKHLQTTCDEVVAVTGDGTNDAPALHEADIGLAMGIAGTEVAKENADVIILDDNFSTIVTLAKWGRSVYISIQKFVQFQLTINVVALIVSSFSACLTGNAPLTTVQLLWVNMIMNALGALALVTEPPNDDLMKRSPVERRGKLISNVMWRNILGQSFYQSMVIWYLQAKGKAIFCLDGPDSDLILNTLIFNSFVFCQVFNEINSREMEKINVFKGIQENYFCVAVLSGTVLFQIIIVEFLGTFADTSPLTLAQWFLGVFIGFLSTPIAAGLKMINVGAT